MNDIQIKNIIENHIFTTLTFYNPVDKIKTTYTYKSCSKNFIFYICKKRKDCNGRGKIDIKKKQFILIEKCNDKIDHTNITYEEFSEIMDKNDINKIDFNKYKNQKYYIYYSIIKDKKIDNETLRINFFTLTIFNLTLSKSIISKIRLKITNQFKHLSAEQLIKKKEDINNDIEHYAIDIKYNYKEKNIEKERKQKIIIFGPKNNLELLSEKNTKEIFMDITFKVVPKNIRPYKLLVLVGLPKTLAFPIILCFILIKFLII